MTNKNYSKHILIIADPELIFTAITQEIDKWWTESSNKIFKVGDQLTVQFEESTTWSMDVIDLRKSSLLLLIYSYSLISAYLECSS